MANQFVIADPEVSTLSTLTNLQNSIFVPNLGKYLNRRPTYNLTQRQPAPAEKPLPVKPLPPTPPGESDDEEKRLERPELAGQRAETGATLNTIDSNVHDQYYAVLPHGVRLSDWSEEDKLELNDHVRHMLHSKRSKFKRQMKGFGKYVSKREYSVFG